MFNNVVLDVFIGLIFIFLLYSLLATILAEIIASRFSLRARMLQKALRRMLEDEGGKSAKEVTTFSIANYFREAGDNIEHFFVPFSKDTLLHKFYSHPSIKYLGEGKLYRKPSYLHGHNFSQTIIHLLRGDQYDGRTQNESELIAKALKDNPLNVNPQTLRHLNLLFADARQDAFIFKHKLEDWFEETMERTTGWYKKQSQTILLAIGFILAVAFNVDTIAIAKILMKDKKIRDQVVELAVVKQKEYGAILDSVKKITVIRTEKRSGDSLITVTIDSTLTNSNTDKYLDSAYRMLADDAAAVQGILGLRGVVTKADSVYCLQTVAYFDSAIIKETDSVKKQKLIATKTKVLACCLKESETQSPYQGWWFFIFIGWLLTAFAISLGAPFWFDLLNKVVKLRESGPRAGNTSAIDNSAVNNSSNPVKDTTNTDIRG